MRLDDVMVLYQVAFASIAVGLVLSCVGAVISNRPREMMFGIVVATIISVALMVLLFITDSDHRDATIHYYPNRPPYTTPEEILLYNQLTFCCL